MNRNLIIGLGAIATLALLIGLALHFQHVLEAGLPPRVECASQSEAQAKASAGAIPVLGTGSMAPYIPAARAGLDPKKTIVAYVVPQSGATFAAVKAGSLCIYSPEWDANARYLHQAAQQDGDGWIMTGLHNAEYESHWRVTPANFIAIAAKVYVWPQQP